MINDETIQLEKEDQYPDEIKEKIIEALRKYQENEEDGETDPYTNLQEDMEFDEKNKKIIKKLEKF